MKDLVRGKGLSKLYGSRHLSLLKCQSQLEIERLISAVNLNFWSKKPNLFKKGRKEGRKKKTQVCYLCNPIMSNGIPPGFSFGPCVICFSYLCFEVNKLQ